jgi:hypothetical protein
VVLLFIKKNQEVLTISCFKYHLHIPFSSINFNPFLNSSSSSAKSIWHTCHNLKLKITLTPSLTADLHRYFHSKLPHWKYFSFLTVLISIIWHVKSNTIINVTTFNHSTLLETNTYNTCFSVAANYPISPCKTENM